MANKGVISKDIIRLDKYIITIDGVDLKAIRVGESNQTMKVVELPDGTAASGGRTEASEFEIEIPEHETKERLLLDKWWSDCKDPISPSAYKVVTITRTSGTGGVSVVEDRVGCFVKGRRGGEMSYDGGSEEMATLIYSISCDDVISS